MSVGKSNKRPADIQNAIDAVVRRADIIESQPTDATFSTLRRLFENPSNRIVVSFGGGSVHGLAGNCALARLLEQLDLWRHVNSVWGTSAGAVVGGCFATGRTSSEILEATVGLAEKRAVDFARWEVLAKGLAKLMLSNSLPDGLIRGDVFRKTVEDCLSVETFEECQIPFRVIACTDDGHARKVVFQEGRLLSAITASMCIPGIVFPTSGKSDGTGYFDGGVVEKTPLISVIEEHRRLNDERQLVVLCSHFDNDARVMAPVGFLQRFMSSLHTMEDVIWNNQLDQCHREEGVKVLTVNPRMELGSMFDFDLARFNYLWALERFKSQLSNARLGLSFGAR
jgi:predicted acylesterase/phospholipase RssA